MNNKYFPLVIRSCAKLFSIIVLFFFLDEARATIVVSDFGTGDSIASAYFDDTWVGSLSETATDSSIGYPATDFGFFIYVLSSPIDFLSNNAFRITARIDPGNTATGFYVNAYSSIVDTATAFFDLSDFSSLTFTTVTQTFTTSGSFDPTNVIGWGISGGSPAPTIDFRVTFDKFEVVPEPQTFTLLACGLGALAIMRKRRKTA